MATVTFTLTGSFADFGADERGGIVVRIVGTPPVKKDSGVIYSDEIFEEVETEPDGTFSKTMVSIPGLWLRASTPYKRCMNPVNFPAYIPDAEDPTTGVPFAPDQTIDVFDIMDEDPTPGYTGIVFVGGGGGVTDHAALTGRSTANSHPISAITGLQTALDAAATDSDLTTHAADTTAVHGITDTAALVVTTDPRLTDARTPSLHAASHAAGQSDQVTPAAIGAAATGHTHTGTYAPVLGADDNYVTDAEKTALHSHPAVIAQGATAADARTAIGAGTSSLVVGTTAGTAAEGNDARLSDARTPTAHTHPATGISDSTATGRAVLTAATQADARTAIGAGTSNLVVGTGAGDAKAGNYQPTAADISDSTATGRAVVTATDAAAARTAIGAGTSSLAVGTTAGTAAEGNDSRLAEGRAQTINAQTGTEYTLQASDAGKLVTLSNTGAITLNAPGSTFSAGQRVDIAVLGAGMVTVAAGSGSPSVNGTPSLVSRAQYSAFSVVALSASAFLVVGDLA